MNEERRRELEELLQYMAPGTTIEQMMEDDSSDDDEVVYETVATKGGSGHVVAVKPLSQAGGANTQQATTSMAKLQPHQHNIQASVLARIHIDDLGFDHGGGSGGAARMNQKVLNELRDATMSSKYTQRHEVDRSERATTENVMDPRTRMILYKLVNSGTLREVNGCVSTGKEANVYYAVGGDGADLAVKVYKTSILVFKDREQYVAGEFRFQRYCKSNPRKMVRTWAEKEARNLGRLSNFGVRAPQVKVLRQHVLVMEFIGEDGWPAPRLKEVKFPTSSSMDRCYLELCVTMRIMFQRCKLVHGDLSEYNLLFCDGHVVVIDVSQSVEHDHPHAMAFLRRDIVNVNAFFRSRGHQHLFSLQDLYFFVTQVDDSGALLGQDREAMTEYLVRLRETREASGPYGPTDAEQAKIDEQVFLRIDVPRTLEGVSDQKAPNKEVKQFVEDMLAPTASAAPAALSDRRGSSESAPPENEPELSGSETRSSASLSDDENDTTEKRIRPVPLSEMTKEERKDHRKAVKAANRERRESKMPKHEKKRATRRVKHK